MYFCISNRFYVQNWKQLPSNKLILWKFINDMKKIQTDLQSRSFKLYYHINNSFLPKFTPTTNFDLYVNFVNADFGLHGVYHVTYSQPACCPHLPSCKVILQCYYLCQPSIQTCPCTGQPVPSHVKVNILF